MVNIMNIYEVIASEYTAIFPSSQEKVNFIETYLTGSKSQHLLDLGCASGEFVYQLSIPSRDITGVDLDPLMIEVAKSNDLAEHTNRIDFVTSDMLTFLRNCTENSYDLISCLGNTIVYLNGEGELREFLTLSHSSLRKGGNLIIQLLNYSNPTIGPGFTFPVAKSERLEFTRGYTRAANSPNLEFHTSTKDKVSGEIHTDIHTHHPFLSKRIGELGREIGFTYTQVFGGYNGKEGSTTDFFHLVILEK